MGKMEKNIPEANRAGILAGLMAVVAMVLVTVPFAFTEIKRNRRP